MTRRDADGLNGGPAGRETAPDLGRPAPAAAEVFRDQALVHGPDLASWPVALRPAAQAFVQAQPRAAATALAEAEALDAALADWAAEAPALSDDLFARLAADADATLPAGFVARGVLATGAASLNAPAPNPTLAPAPRPAAADPRRGRPSARAAQDARGGFRPLARLGAPAAFAASAMLGLALGYAGDDPLSQGFAALAMDQYEAAYEISLLDADLLSDDAFPDAETVQ